MKPTVGRIVHFYNEAYGEDEHNWAGCGPYAAIVAQVHSDSCASLVVFPAFSPMFQEGSVSEGAPGSGRYWCWPPIGTPSSPS